MSKTTKKNRTTKQDKKNKEMTKTTKKMIKKETAEAMPPMPKKETTKPKNPKNTRTKEILMSTNTTTKTTAPKKRGRKPEELIGKTLGNWKVLRCFGKATPNLFVCEHTQIPGLQRTVSRSTLFVNRSYWKRASLYNAVKQIMK